jgi:hypothetical protein
MTVDRDRPCGRDQGSTSLSVVLIAPILVVLMFAGLQAALWNHSRARARVVARSTAAMIARDEVPAGHAMQVAYESLGDHLTNPHVAIQTVAGNIVVRISGDAPGILRGTSRGLVVTIALPIEGWVPL